MITILKKNNKTMKIFNNWNFTSQSWSCDVILSTKEPNTTIIDPVSSPHHTVKSSIATIPNKKIHDDTNLIINRLGQWLPHPRTFLTPRTLVPVTCNLLSFLFLENYNIANKWPTSRALPMTVSIHTNSSWRNDILMTKDKSYQSHHMGSKPTQNLKISVS